MLKETRRDTPICIIIFTRYITPVIRLSASSLYVYRFTVKSLRSLVYVHPGRVRLSHACKVFSRGKGTAIRESRGATRAALRGVFGTNRDTECGWPLPSRNSLIAASSPYNFFYSPRNYCRGKLLARYIYSGKKFKKLRCHLLCHCNITFIVILRRHCTVNNTQNFLPQRTDVVTTRCAREIVCK